MKFDLQLLQVRTQLAICGTPILSPLSEGLSAPESFSLNGLSRDEPPVNVRFGTQRT